MLFFVLGTGTNLQDLEGEGGMPGFNTGSGGDDSGSLGETLHLSHIKLCLLYTSPSPRDATLSRMPSSA